MADEVKVFQVNECEWWMGHNAEEVKSAYLKERDMTAKDAFDDSFHGLSPEEMEKLVYVDTTELDYGGSVQRRSFKEELNRELEAGFSAPGFFASTEY